MPILRQQKLKPDLVLVPQVVLQSLLVLAVVVAELALVGLYLIMLVDVQLEALVAGAGEGAFVAAEHNALQVAGELGAGDLQRYNAFFWRVAERQEEKT